MTSNCPKWPQKWPQMTSKMTSNGHFRIGNRTCAFIWYFRVCRCIKQWRYLLNRWIIQEGDMTTITQKNSICQKKIVKMTTEIISKRSQSKKMTDGFFSIYNLMINGRQRKLTLHYHQVLSLWLLWRQSWVHRNRCILVWTFLFCPWSSKQA